MAERYLIKTDHGDVVVNVADDQDGLDPNLLSFEHPTPDNTADLEMEVPLRAFAAKMIAIVERTTHSTPGGETMRRMMIQEKATADLRRIERWVKQHVND